MSEQQPRASSSGSSSRGGAGKHRGKPQHPGHSVNRNQSVRFLGYLRNSVSSKLSTDRLVQKSGTDEFRSR